MFPALIVNCGLLELSQLVSIAKDTLMLSPIVNKLYMLVSLTKNPVPFISKLSREYFKLSLLGAGGGLPLLTTLSLPQAARLNTKNIVKSIATAITNRFRNSAGFIKVFIKYCFDLLKNNKNRLNFKMQFHGDINFALSTI
jgi:hypothetical protein